MGMPIQFSKALVPANATSLAAIQAHAGDGAVSLSGGTIASQRRVLITLTASNSGNVIIVAGTNESGTPIGESITCSATGTVFPTVMDYKSITLVSTTSLVGNISVGTNTTGSSPWQMTNPWNDPVDITVAVSLPTSGAATYSCEYTIDLDPCGIRNNTPLTAVNAFVSTLHSALTTSAVALIAAGNATTNWPVPCSAWRLTITTGTGNCIVQSIDAGAGAG